jgi:hypothetical protein
MRVLTTGSSAYAPSGDVAMRIDERPALKGQHGALPWV